MDFKIGVPQGFYPNKYLVEINKGTLPQRLRDKPCRIKCWGCDELMEVCGYPFYICPNDHIYNAETGERWIWKPTDEVYHNLLKLKANVESKYQGLFFSGSRKRVETEADRTSSELLKLSVPLIVNTNINYVPRVIWHITDILCYKLFKRLSCKRHDFTIS